MFSVVERAHDCTNCGNSSLKRKRFNKCVKPLRLSQTDKLSNPKAHLEKPREIQYI